MTADVAPLIALGGAGLAILAAAGWSMAIRWRSQALRFRSALSESDAREAAFVEAARRLADAARTSIEAVREEMVRAVRAIAPGLDAVVFLEEAEAQLVCVAANGARVAYFEGARFALDDDASLVALALRAGHRLTLLDVPGVKPLHPADIFAAAVPLVLDAGRRCVLYVGGDTDTRAAIADRIVRLVDQATPSYRIALERADDRTRAEYDGLTGLVTARAFRTQLAHLTEQARCRPFGRLGLLFIDTDRFKSWNDLYGHASGDALLRELALLLRAAATDPSDIVARNGGDEFCVVFADAEKSSAIERAERLRASIAEANFTGLHAPIAEGEEVRISASIGIACFPSDAQSPENLLEKADEAMYHSKRTGRDGVSFFGVDATLVRADGATEERAADRRRDR